jgi:hypothetical protein
MPPPAAGPLSFNQVALLCDAAQSSLKITQRPITGIAAPKLQTPMRHVFSWFAVCIFTRLSLRLNANARLILSVNSTSSNQDPMINTTPNNCFISLCSHKCYGYVNESKNEIKVFLCVEASHQGGIWSDLLQNLRYESGLARLTWKPGSDIISPHTHERTSNFARTFQYPEWVHRSKLHLRW